ncbi:zinc finger protein 189-like [Episyrphus balteatus]|uniref:zinc finger protein 189-like n=1 Tax=Episyrphus balteatus TaxID=286459 RepID=UPI002486BA6C|nr:zinc finger protein 189-like [Episyrphus balteatus]
MNLEVCRICGTTSDLKNIFTQGNDELVEQIRLCANIQIDANDCLPKFVCHECENGLAFSYRLRKRGEETEKKLRQDLLLTTIEPYSVVDESVINSEDDDNSEMVEEFCDEEIWINDDEDFDKPESLIDRVSESGDEEEVIVHDIVEELTWVEEKNEYHEPEEVTDDGIVIEPVEQNIAEVFEEVLETQDESNIEPAEVEPDTQTLKNKPRIITCLLFEEKSSAKSQKQTKPHKDKKRFHCEVCDKWFVHRFRFDEHMKNHQSDGEKAFPCSQCDKSYTNQGNMERHVRSAHKLERKFQCYECGASFGRADILKMHMFMHTDQRTIECKICQKKFKTNQSLHYHMRVHKNKPVRVKKPKKDKPKSKSKSQIYLCDQCDKISRHRTTHLNHMRTHTGDKPFKCSICDKAFRTTSARTNHELLHTDKRPHTCKSCGLSFRQTSHLSSHMLTHTGDKRHVCNVCQKAFAMRSNLVVHLRIHSGEMPYVCINCPKKFLLSSQFKRHKLIHEEGDEQTESDKNGIEIGEEFHDSQISLYIDDIIERNTEGFEEDIIVSE